MKDLKQMAEKLVTTIFPNKTIVEQAVEKALRSVREEAVRECADIFPKNWIDSRMQVLEIPAGCPQIEGLLLHLKSEVLKLLTPTKEGRTKEDGHEN